MEASAALVLVIVFGLLIYYGMPIAFSILAAAVVTILMYLPPSFAFFASAQKIASGIDSFSLLAVPFFILAGNLMSTGGIARRLVNLSLALMGKVPGSLALTNIVGNALFGSLSGSGIAAASAIGGVLNPIEKEENYDEGYIAAVNVASAPVGQLIPPTTAPIIYSAAAGGVSISALFIACWIPGIIWALACMIVAYRFGKKNNYVVDSERIINRSNATKVFIEAIPSLLLIVIIIGGILSGVFTPTESSVIAVLYSFILSVFIYKEIDTKTLMNILEKTAVMTTIVMLIIGTSNVLSFIMSFTNIPQRISEIMLGISGNKYVILFLINLILLFVGTFMDMAPSLMIFTPIFLPILVQLGISPIHFGVIIIMNLALGTITPPLGNVLYVGCSIANVSPKKAIKYLLPYIIVIIISLLFITFIPAISMTLPKVLGLI